MPVRSNTSRAVTSAAQLVERWIPGKTASLGVDEVGWGAGAGPLLVVGAALYHTVPGLRDSKQIKEETRDSLYDQVLLACAYVHTAIRDVDFINQKGLADSWHSAFKECVDALVANVPGVMVVVDGDKSVRGVDHQLYVLQPKADTFVPGVAAASILAKVERDALMRELDGRHPGYGFARHKGYFTAEHIEAIGRLGLSPQHRYTAEKFTSAPTRRSAPSSAWRA